MSLKSWFTNKRNTYAFNHYFLPYLTKEELSRHSYENLMDFHFFFTNSAKFLPKNQKLFAKKLKSNSVLFVLFQEEKGRVFNVKTLILNPSVRRKPDEVNTTLKKLEKYFNAGH